MMGILLGTVSSQALIAGAPAAGLGPENREFNSTAFRMGTHSGAINNSSSAFAVKGQMFRAEVPILVTETHIDCETSGPREILIMKMDGPGTSAVATEVYRQTFTSIGGPQTVVLTTPIEMERDQHFFIGLLRSDGSGTTSCGLRFNDTAGSIQYTGNAVERIDSHRMNDNNPQVGDSLTDTNTGVWHIWPTIKTMSSRGFAYPEGVFTYARTWAWNSGNVFDRSFSNRDFSVPGKHLISYTSSSGGTGDSDSPLASITITGQRDDSVVYNANFVARFEHNYDTVEWWSIDIDQPGAYVVKMDNSSTDFRGYIQIFEIYGGDVRFAQMYGANGTPVNIIFTPPVGAGLFAVGWDNIAGGAMGGLPTFTTDPFVIETGFTYGDMIQENSNGNQVTVSWTNPTTSDRGLMTVLSVPYISEIDATSFSYEYAAYYVLLGGASDQRIKVDYTTNYLILGGGFADRLSIEKTDTYLLITE